MGPEKGARMSVKEPGKRQPAGREREETGPDPAEEGRFLYIIIILCRWTALYPLFGTVLGGAGKRTRENGSASSPEAGRGRRGKGGSCTNVHLKNRKRTYTPLNVIKRVGIKRKKAQKAIEIYGQAPYNRIELLG